MSLFFLLKSGGQGGVVTLTDDSIYDYDDDPTVPLVYFQFKTDGTVWETPPTAQINSATDWIIPNSSASSLYEIYATEFSGSGTGTPVKTGTMDSWLPMSSNRTWQLTNTSVGDYTWVIDVSIRFNGGATLATGRFTLRAQQGFVP